MRNNNKFFQKFAAAIVKRSGICQATVEAVLPHVFDEIRYQLTEGCGYVAIEGFGTFVAKDIPEHEFLYHRGDKREVHVVPAKKVVKFAPTRNLTNEVSQSHYDDTRHSFQHMPGDPKLRLRGNLTYRKPKGYKQGEGSWGSPIYKKKDDVRSKMEDTHQPSDINHQT
jgi:nucleoid DNA-binding protein